MKSLYRNLAKDGIKRYKKLYYPFIGTTIFFIVLINLCLSIIFDETLNSLHGMSNMSYIIFLGIFILILFSTVSIHTNYKFIQKGKASENGLYLILGMEKKHLNKIYGYELANIYLISAALGSLISLVLYKFASALLVKLLGNNLNVLESGIFPSFKPIGITALIFLAIFILLYIAQIFRSRNFNPISYINESKSGEKPPRYPIFNGVAGALLIAAGYYLSLTVGSSIAALQRFWIAVILVIIGTKLAFSVIVSKVLKLLQKNKNYYFKKDNFTAVSGLLYRVRKSASTLSDIAILSTMVIIVLTSGFSLYLGAEDLVNSLYPSDYKVTIHDIKDSEDKYIESIKNTLDSKNLDYNMYYYFGGASLIDLEDGIAKNVSKNLSYSEFLKYKSIAIYLDKNSEVDFKDSDALLITADDSEIIKDIGNMGLKITRIENYPMVFARETTSFENYDKLILKDPELFDKITKYLTPDDDFYEQKQLVINTDVESEYDKDLAYTIRENLNNDMPESAIRVSDAVYDRNEFYTLYAGIFFVGIILGLGFIVSTVLAIYYKQLSEGLEDISRFKTMRQLGMTDREAKKSISKQMGLVFSLPLIFAFSHSLFAMPIVIKFLGIIGLSNVRLFITCLLVVFSAYILFYLVTYKLTAKTYNNIVLDSN